MPSPFPGMDPYLESLAIFPNLHNNFITYLQEAVNLRLPPPYYASSATRAWIEAATRHIEPDVDVLRPVDHGNGTSAGHANGQGGVAVAELVEAEPIVVRVPLEEFQEPFLEIFAQSGGERMVTTVEVLSPTNKTPGAHGRDLYLQKQREVLAGQVHLVEIDLLRRGTHTTAVPLRNALERTGTFDYHVCVVRYDKLEEYAVYPIHLERRLPVIALPLLPGDAPVKVDLQAVLDRCYDTGIYRRRVHYRDDVPAPALRPEQSAWLDQLLRQQGLRV